MIIASTGGGTMTEQPVPGASANDDNAQTRAEEEQPATVEPGSASLAEAKPNLKGEVPKLGGKTALMIAKMMLSYPYQRLRVRAITTCDWLLQR
jgi:hypothetical protein